MFYTGFTVQLKAKILAEKSLVNLSFDYIHIKKHACNIYSDKPADLHSLVSIFFHS